MLWFEQIFPILFIFTIFTNLLLDSNILSRISSKKIIFIIFVLGCIFGFPIGAKLTCDFGSKKLIDRQYFEFLSAISNHFSIPFIIAYTIINQLDMKSYTLQILFCLYTPSVIMLVLFLISHSFDNSPCKENLSDQSGKKTAPQFKLNTQIIDAGIINGFETLIKLCAYIVLFSVISRIPLQFNCKNSLIPDISFAFLEATNGIHNICSLPINLNIKLIICISILSLGGMSCTLQTRSMFSNHKFNILKYVMFKFILTTASIILLFIVI